MSQHAAAPVGDAAAVEARWSAWRLDRNRRGLITMLWMVIPLYPLFGVLDYLVAPRSWLWALFLTRAFVTGVSVLMFRVARTSLFGRAHTLVTAGYVVLTCLGISFMTTFMGGLASPYYAGLGLVLIGVGLLFLWPPRLVLATNAIIVASFVGPNLLVDRSPTLLPVIQNLFFLVSTAVITAIGQVFAYGTQLEQVRNQAELERTQKVLEAAHERLKLLDKYKSQFFANITHELKTPLALILSPLELMLDGELGEITEAQRATLRSMFNSGAKLLKLIGDLLDLSKMEESQLRIRVQERDVVTWLRALVFQVEPLTQRKRIDLAFATDTPAASVCFDAERMERVIINLLSNAAKFTDEGGHIRVAIRDGADEVELVVEDDGVGFPADKAEQIFERFYQVDMAGTRRYGGAGIGLALAREIVSLHGGTLTAEGEPGKGARFFVRLKKGREHFRSEALDRRTGRRDVHGGGQRATDRSATEWAMQITTRDDFRLLEIVDATERRLLPRDPDEADRGRTVLVVEDTPDVTRVVHLALRQEFRVMAATDGEKGLELALRELPDVIVTDLMMPGLDGLELTRALRADARTRHIPIVMLTAHTDLDDRIAGIETGVNAYLGKPFSAKELLGTVRSLVDRQASTADILLEQRMGSLQMIAGGLAHQINNPLNYVKNALVRIRRDVDALRAELAAPAPDAAKLATIDARVAKMFGTAEAGIGRIGETVQLMGRYSREGYSRLLRPHDLFGAARDVVALLVPASGRDIGADATFEGEGVVDCVPEEMNQVLTNVIQNAMDAVEDGRGRVEVRGTVKGDLVEIRVKDNGVGISAEDRARIFTPFYTTKGPGRGMGLGLTITWRVVHSLGGTVQVDSEPGHGTTMTLTLPRSRESIVGMPAA